MVALVCRKKFLQINITTKNREDFHDLYRNIFLDCDDNQRNFIKKRNRKFFKNLETF